MVRRHYQLEGIILPVNIIVKMPYPDLSSDRGIISRYVSVARLCKLEMLVKHMKCGKCIYSKIVAVGTVYSANDVIIVIGVANVINKKSGWCGRLQQDSLIRDRSADSTGRVTAYYSLLHIPVFCVLGNNCRTAISTFKSGGAITMHHLIALWAIAMRRACQRKIKVLKERIHGTIAAVLTNIIIAARALGRLGA